MSADPPSPGFGKASPERASRAEAGPRRSCLAVGLFLILAALASGMLQAQGPPDRPFPRPPRTGGTVSSTHPVSPAVVVSWITRRLPDESGSLELLVLWRGTPGWFTRSGGGSGGSGMSSGGGSSNGGRETFFMRASEGGVTFEIALVFEGGRRQQLQLQGRDVAIGDDNVVLMDGVDGPGGPTLVGTRHIDPAMAEPHDIAAIIRRSPELVSFLRCDLTLPDQITQWMIEKLCARFAQ